MSSSWAFPTQITQFSENDFENIHVPWQEADNFFSLKHNDGRNTRTVKDLLHIARDPKPGLLDKTYYLKCTGFNFTDTPEHLTGIQLRLKVNRGGRITDDTIQFTINDNFIGDNKADNNCDNIKLYGDENDLWGTQLGINDVMSTAFGVILRFKSHPKYPHRTSPFIDTVELRIY